METGSETLTVSFVRDDLPFRVMRRMGLVPRDGAGLGVVRRAVFFALLTWLPIVVWALYAGRALPEAPVEPLLQHFDVHARCLLAIPVLILAQGLAHRLLTGLLPWFVRSGVVPPGEVGRFRELVQRVAALRTSTLPWAFIAGAAIAVTFGAAPDERSHELAWSLVDPNSPSPHFGFGGWWLVYVARPVFLALLLAWMWRFVLLAVLFRGIAQLDLSLVPTHPDRVGGLGFLDRLAAMAAPVVFAISVVFCSHWAHRVVYHDVPLQALAAPALALLALMLLVFLGPFAFFVPTLGAARRRAELEYGALVADHGRRLRRQWILGETLEDRSILDAPELGALADVGVTYENVLRLRALPIGVRGLLAVVLPAALPLLAVVATRVPLREILGTLARVLV